MDKKKLVDSEIKKAEEKKKLGMLFQITNRMIGEDGLYPTIMALGKDGRIALMVLGREQDQYWLEQKETAPELVEYVSRHNCLSYVFGLDKDIKIGKAVIYKSRMKRLSEKLRKEMYGPDRTDFELKELIRPIILAIYNIRVQADSMDEEECEEFEAKKDNIQENRFMQLAYAMHYKLAKEYTLEEVTEIWENYKEYFTLPYNKIK